MTTGPSKKSNGKNPNDPLAAQRKSAETCSIFSSCCGYTGEVTLSNSAIVILLAGLLGASDMFSILTTSLLPLFCGLMILPMAIQANRIGLRRLINISCASSAVVYFLAAASPWFGSYARGVLIVSIILFSLLLSGFTAGWFPLADSFLLKDRRIIFFSRLRFWYQLAAAGFLTVSGFFVGRESPIWKLQLVLFVAAVINVGRFVFMSRVPAVFVGSGTNTVSSLKAALSHVIANKPMVGFSLYIFVLNLAAYGTFPLTLLYMKKGLNAPDNIIVFISAMSLVGMLAGYLVVGRIVARIGVKHSLLLFHVAFAVVNLGLFFIHEGNMVIYGLIGIFTMLYNFVVASASIVTASEMMVLSTSGEKSVTMAFFWAFYSGGVGLSRLMTSFLLGSGMLATQWRIGGMEFCRYQTLFLLFTVCIIFAAVFLLVVPAVFPRGEFKYPSEL